ncbi:restless-like transposase [Beauveria bassiana ARSEF 2860]|uniref:Restless-like transposase n=1 Tax=Beauveria bassiana (strain ARSEF 2860) TaxID=655819 RepID=J4KQU8_BEAB2|nr:restless-like transposase [Beauveria bassiana ARSEF 2860]EJP69829.1 restless-like transposase [Beauveria bassiana ARSEF 2860]
MRLYVLISFAAMAMAAAATRLNLLEADPSPSPSFAEVQDDSPNVDGEINPNACYWEGSAPFCEGRCACAIRHLGYDVQNFDGNRRWVCKRCIRIKSPRARGFAEKGIQNANAHLFRDRGICAPDDGTKSSAQKRAEKVKTKHQRSITDMMKLDTRLPREQDIANHLVQGFDRKHFQRLVLEWIVEENHAFRVCEQGRLRTIFEYLNPLVKITDANISRTTIRYKVLASYEAHKDKVATVLQKSPGLIHISFDGWRSGNRHSLYGVTCFFRDENNNAESNDTVMEVIGGELGFVGSTRRGRCFGHSLNLSAKALLFGHNAAAFEEQLSGAAPLSEAEHTLWRRKGPVGKLHNLVVDVRRSDQLTYLLRSIQRSEFDMSSDLRIQASTPLDLIIDNDTRWLSQLYMIRRALTLRPFLEQLILKHRQQWEQEVRSKRTGGIKKSAKEPRICMEVNQLTSNDWIVLEHLAKLLGFYEDAIRTLEGDANCASESEDGLAHRPDWVMKAKQMAQEVWETQYRRLRAEPNLVTGNSAAKRQRKYYNPLQVYCERTRSVSASVAVKDELADADRFDGEDDEDELELWHSSWEDGDGDVRDLLSYWHERRRRYPRLSRMAMDFLTIQAMSAECERLFSAAGRMVTPLRSRLDADMIGMCQVLRSWLRAGVIDDLDVLLVPVDQCSDEVEGELMDEEEDE